MGKWTHVITKIKKISVCRFFKIFLITLLGFVRIRSPHVRFALRYRLCEPTIVWTAVQIRQGKPEKLKMPHCGGIFDFWQGHLCNSRTDEIKDLLQFGKEIKLFLNKYENNIIPRWCVSPSGSIGNRPRNCHRYEPAAPHTPPSIRLWNRQTQIEKKFKGLYAKGQIF